ncbi:hypothetical protein HDV00_000904 [Rhizophlyctis rosea]|nr:hypothetical protein HDV00_000904 [Rhizophlyctis rosea]
MDPSSTQQQQQQQQQSTVSLGTLSQPHLTLPSSSYTLYPAAAPAANPPTPVLPSSSFGSSARPRMQLPIPPAAAFLPASVVNMPVTVVPGQSSSAGTVGTHGGGSASSFSALSAHYAARGVTQQQQQQQPQNQQPQAQYSAQSYGAYPYSTYPYAQQPSMMYPTPSPTYSTHAHPQVGTTTASQYAAGSSSVSYPFPQGATPASAGTYGVGASSYETMQSHTTHTHTHPHAQHQHHYHHHHQPSSSSSSSSFTTTLQYPYQQQPYHSYHTHQQPQFPLASPPLPTPPPDSGSEFGGGYLGAGSASLGGGEVESGEGGSDEGEDEGVVVAVRTGRRRKGGEGGSGDRNGAKTFHCFEPGW